MWSRASAWSLRAGGLLAGGALIVRQAPASESEGKKPGRPLVVCGPSGVGKGTLITRLMKECPNDFGFSVSHTTRTPRPGEVNGVHYHFSTKEDMERMIANGEFIEHAHVHGNIYGTSRKAVEDVGKQGKVCILDIDVQGAQLVNAAKMKAFFVFIQPPSFAELERRLRGRGTESEEKVQLRLKNAHKELESLGLPMWDRCLVNTDLEKTYAKFKAEVIANCFKS